MSKNAKKIKVLEDRIAEIEAEMAQALQRKQSNKTAFNVPEALKKIADLKADVKRLK
jgi:C4-dicarboxylate-specific signal transduction histidine kinase